MVKRFFYSLCILLSFFMISSCVSTSLTKKLTIATASNCQEAIKEITNIFTKQTGLECEIIVGSSGKLSAQIMNGAPYDIFISADMKYPLEIDKKKLAIETPKVFAQGKLILWTQIKNIPLDLDSLLSNRINKIAIANPKTAPFGEAAWQVLSNQNNFQLIEKKLVYGESVTQANQFVLSSSAEIGFTSVSTVFSKELKDKGSWMEIDASSYNPIELGIVLIDRKNKSKSDANKFFDFVFSKEAKDVLMNFGYSVNE